MFKAPKSSMSYPVSVCVLIYDVIITWFVTPLTWLFPPKALSALLSKSRSLAWRELKKYRSMRFFRTLSRYKTTRIYKEIKAVVSLKTRGTGVGRLSCWRGRDPGEGSRGGIPGRDPRQGSQAGMSVCRFELNLCLVKPTLYHSGFDCKHSRLLSLMFFN